MDGTYYYYYFFLFGCLSHLRISVWQSLDLVKPLQLTLFLSSYISSAQFSQLLRFSIIVGWLFDKFTSYWNLKSIADKLFSTNISVNALLQQIDLVSDVVHQTVLAKSTSSKPQFGSFRAEKPFEKQQNTPIRAQFSNGVKKSDRIIWNHGLEVHTFRCFVSKKKISRL